MKEFTKTEIDKWREECIRRLYPQKTARLDSRSIDYFVLPTPLFKGIPNGLSRMTGDFQDGYVIGVSQEVPETIKPYFAVSEHDEFMVYGLKDLDRTLHSEQNILNILKDEKSLRTFYIDNKLLLYEYMLKNSKDNLETWGFTQEDYNGFQKALEFLKNKEG